MNSLSSSAEEARTLFEDRPAGNLALCQPTTNENGKPECLGHSQESLGGEESMQSRTDTLRDAKNPLNWRFEGGLLRSVGPDGYATDLCLGPNESVTALDGTTNNLYELVLQDCPSSILEGGEKENIFSHPTINSVSTSSTEEDGGEILLEATSTTTHSKTIEHRHMQFLIVGDGRIQSLARVHGEGTTDIITEKPFCLTTMKFGEDVGESNIMPTLAPCVDGDSTIDVVIEDAEGDCTQSIQPSQQFFDVNSASSFGSYIFNWQNEDDQTLNLAYQIGFDGHSFFDRTENYDRFDSFVVRVLSDGNPSLEQDPSLLLEETVSHRFDRKSGILSHPLTDFKVYGNMEAHLIGISLGGLESNWLASTTFEISASTIHDGLPSFFWAFVCFLSFMAFYFLVVKANRLCCPTFARRQRKQQRKRKKKKRDSEQTIVTVNSANGEIDYDSSGELHVENDPTASTIQVSRSRSNESNSSHSGRSRGRIPAILFRISEEDLDAIDIENNSSRISDAERTASETTADTTEELNRL